MDESYKDTEGAMGEPDIDHEDVERMNPEHLEDLERQHVSHGPTLACNFLTLPDKSVSQSWTSNAN